MDKLNLEELLNQLSGNNTIVMDWNDMFAMNVKREWACELPSANIQFKNETLAQMREVKNAYQKLMEQFVVGNAKNLNTTVSKLSDCEVEQGVWAAFNGFVKQLIQFGYSTGEYSAGELDSDVITSKILFEVNGNKTPFFRTLIKQTLKRIKKGGK